MQKIMDLCSCLSLFRSPSTAATYVFTAPTCTTTIIGLEPCSINAETLYDFQHSILKILKIPKEGMRVKGGPKRRLLFG